jgi:hypothetical protein
MATDVSRPWVEKCRLLQWTAKPRLPLFAVSDQTRAALQYVATGQQATPRPSVLGAARRVSTNQVRWSAQAYTPRASRTA